MSSNLSSLFFHDLKQYNPTNFRTLEKLDLAADTPTLHKSCSSVVTRYFIFREKHPEFSDTDMKMLYFQLKIDMIARYFAEYPAASIDDLKPFQTELRNYVKSRKGDDMNVDNI